MWANIPALLGSAALSAAGVSLLLAVLDTAKWIERVTARRHTTMRQ